MLVFIDYRVWHVDLYFRCYIPWKDWFGNHFTPYYPLRSQWPVIVRAEQSCSKNGFHFLQANLSSFELWDTFLLLLNFAH